MPCALPGVRQGPQRSSVRLPCPKGTQSVGLGDRPALRSRGQWEAGLKPQCRPLLCPAVLAGLWPHHSAPGMATRSDMLRSAAAEATGLRTCPSQTCEGLGGQTGLSPQVGEAGQEESGCVGVAIDEFA